MRLLATVLIAAAFIVAAQDCSFADSKPKKGTYASCIATAMKHGSSERNAAQWCSRHGYK